MSNMSYCRFENTLHDLKDCYEYMDEAKSESEIKARKRLVELCQEIAADYGDSYGRPEE